MASLYTAHCFPNFPLFRCPTLLKNRVFKTIWLMRGNIKILTERTLSGHKYWLEPSLEGWGGVSHAPGEWGIQRWWVPIHMLWVPIHMLYPRLHGSHHPRLPLLRGHPDIIWDLLEIEPGWGRSESCICGETLVWKIEGLFRCAQGLLGDSTADGYFCSLPYSLLLTGQSVSSCPREKLHPWERNS